MMLTGLIFDDNISNALSISTTRIPNCGLFSCALSRILSVYRVKILKLVILLLCGVSKSASCCMHRGALHESDIFKWAVDYQTCN